MLIVDSQSYQPGIRTYNRYPARSYSGGQQYASPVIDSRTQTGQCIWSCTALLFKLLCRVGSTDRVPSQWPGGARWNSGRASDSESRGPEFDPH